MFAGWADFYVMLGAAGASLIGLLFVVVTLTAGRDRSTTLRGSSIYLTPTVSHFAVVLLVSAVALTPGLGPGYVEALVGACALAGFAHALTVVVRLQLGHSPEAPHWSDHWCYGVGPLVLYLGLGAAALEAERAPNRGPYAIGAVVLLLLLVSIRNAWDLITWLAPRREEPEPPKPAA